MSGTDYLLDTNVVIGLLRADPATVALLETYPEMLEHCAVSQITRMELLGFPGLQQEDEQEVEAFLINCRVLPLDGAIEREAIALRRTGRFRLPDAIIAATARRNELQLVTLDVRFAKAVAAYG